jgi:hypothetical protein
MRDKYLNQQDSFWDWNLHCESGVKNHLLYLMKVNFVLNYKKLYIWILTVTIQALPLLTQFQNYGTLKLKKNKTIFFKCAEFFLAEMKVQWDEGCGRIMLGNNTCVGALILRPITFQSLGMDCLVYINTYLTIWIPNSDARKKKSNCAGPSGAQVLRLSGSVCVSKII